jgi:hypothetical protein
MLAMALAFGMVLAGCDTDTGGDTNNSGNTDTGSGSGTDGTGTGTDSTGTGGTGTGGTGTDTGTGSTGTDTGTGTDGTGTSGSGDGSVAKPSKPTGVKVATLSSSSIKITWDSVSDATSYNVYYDPKGSSITNDLVETVTTTSYTHTGLSANTRYSYRVTALNDAGESEKSTAYILTTKASDSGTGTGDTGSGGSGDSGSGSGGGTVTKPNAPYGAPVVPSANRTSTSLKIEWNAAPNATSYKLYYSLSSGGSFSELYSGSATTYTHTGLSAETTYYYKVTAVNSAGESGFSDVAQGTTKE